MKILEIRRHSRRDDPAPHLNQLGVTLARLVGEGLGPFDRVVTSTHPRAFETAIAMGFAVDEQNELMSSFGDEVMVEAPWPLSFAQYAETVKRKGPAGKYAHQLMKVYEHIMKYISEERSALVVNHGGVLELGVSACLPEMNFSPWGDAVDYCEGARLFWTDGKFIRGEVLRVRR
ncbi:MAG: histidine phosphatase family protein [Chloroflexi bacterium]|nr:histidine phosphatase family protein [Chloroflexota bacterium]